MPKLSKHDHSFIISRHNKGYGCEEIAKKLGVTRQSIHHFLKSRGIGRTDEFKRHVSTITRMLNEGKSINDIAVHLGRSYTYVYTRVRKHGLIVPRNVRPPSKKYFWVPEMKALLSKGKSVREISAITSRTVTTVKYRIHKLKKLEEIK